MAEERRQRIAEQKAIEAERKREREERERKERLARQEKEAQAKAEKAERERKAKEERLVREAKERELREKREQEEKERAEKERLEQAKAEERKKQEALAAAASVKVKSTPATSPRAPNYPPGPVIQQGKKPTNITGVKPNGPLPQPQRPIASPMSRPPQMQQPPQPIPGNSQRPMVGQGQGVPINLQLPPNMGISPLGIAPPFNPMVSPIAISPRIGYGPASATGVGHGPFSPIVPFVQGQGQPGMMNGSIAGNMQQYPFDTQSPLVSQPPGAMSLQPSRPSSTLPPALAMPPPKAPGTPTVSGVPPIGVPPGGSSATASAAHIRRASAQGNPSPFGAIGKPRGAPSSVVEDDDRGLGTLPIMSPPSPERVLGSSALVDENDTIVELPKRRSASGRIDTIGAPAAVGSTVGSRWGARGTASWPSPNTPGPVGTQWSAAPGRPQPNRLDSPFSPS